MRTHQAISNGKAHPWTSANITRVILVQRQSRMKILPGPCISLLLSPLFAPRLPAHHRHRPLHLGRPKLRRKTGQAPRKPMVTPRLSSQSAKNQQSQQSQRKHPDQPLLNYLHESLPSSTTFPTSTPKPLPPSPSSMPVPTKTNILALVIMPWTVTARKNGVSINNLHQHGASS